MANAFSNGVFAADSKRLERYINYRKIGSGVSGVVHQTQDRETGDTVALKHVILEEALFSVTEEILYSVSLLKLVEHPSLVKIIDVMYTNLKSMHIVMEYLEMDLNRYLRSNITEIKEELIRSYLKQILEGLVGLSSYGITHRAIKPSNILMDNQGHIKLTDFSRRSYVLKHDSPYLHTVVGLWYVAPELLLGALDNGWAADIWSVGCVFAEMFSRKILFKGDSQIDQLFQIFQVLGTPDEIIWPEVTMLPFYDGRMPNWGAKDLHEVVPVPNRDAEYILEQLLTYFPVVRPSAKDILMHNYVKNAKLVSPRLEELI